jgi:hypothetical protein
MGEPVIHTWHPACRLHGTDAVVVNDQDGRSFYCIKCGRKLEVRDGCVEVMWQPPAKNQPKPQPTMEAANV